MMEKVNEKFFVGFVEEKGKEWKERWNENGCILKRERVKKRNFEVL